MASVKSLKTLSSSGILSLAKISSILIIIEKEAREGGFSNEERERLRKERAPEILEKIKVILENPGKVILPQSNVGGAIKHALKNWEQLVKYVEDGKLEIDNNFIENQIRPVALGRKNWLFSGSHDGAERLAMIYSIIGTCKANNIDPMK